MSLRQKTLLIVGATLISLVGVLFATSSTILLGSLKQAEEENTRQALKGVLSVFTQTTEDLSSRFSDWSAWDDTYTFIQDGNKEYIKSNLVPEQLANLKVNLALFVNKSGKIVFGTGFDLNSKRYTPIPQALPDQLSSSNLLLNHPTADSKVHGLVLLPQGAMMLTSQPIVTSKSLGPVRGTIIFGRYLNDAQIEKLSQITRLPIQLEKIDAPELPPDLEAARQELLDQSKQNQIDQARQEMARVPSSARTKPTPPILVRPIDEHSIAGYTLLEDIYGKPALLLRVTVAREIYRQGEKSQNLLILSLVLVGFGFGGCVVILLERLVLSRLAGVSADVSRIGKHRDLSLRLSVAGNDELSSLADTINEMLGALEQAQQERRESEERYRAVIEQSSEGIYLFDVSNKRILEANPALENLLGYPTRSLLQLTIYDIIAQDQESIDRNLHLLSQQHRAISERRYRCQDGTVIDVEVGASLISYGGRKVVCTVVRDITERKKASQVLKASEKRLRKQNLVLVKLAKSRSLNEGNLHLYCRQVTQCAAKTLNTARVGVWLYSEDRSKLECLDLYQKDSKQHSQGGELAALDYPIYFHALESERTLVVSDVDSDHRAIEFRNSYMTAVGVKALLDAPIRVGGQLVGVVCHEHTGTARTWTMDEQNFAGSIADLVALSLEARERQRVQEALRQAEEKYRMIFEHAVEGIFQSTPDGKYISANLALARIYGYSSPALLMANITDINRQLYVDSQRRAAFVAAMEEQGAVWQFESQIYCQDGTVIWISENARAVRDAEGKLLYYEGIVEDVTNRKVMEEALRYQQEQSERLLLNILPQPIADRLKMEEGTIADSFPEVTVLFADIVGFTQISNCISPTELVNLLNCIFSAFDRLAEQHGLEKIKTIGDAYMVVGGIPTHRPDHAEAIAQMALDMQTALHRFNTETGLMLAMRIGINTGPVVAGVIGIKKFIYDLWGDTVNIASRMESHGVPGAIQVTAETYELLKDKYLFEERGLIYVKGKGDMIAYLLRGRL